MESAINSISTLPGIILSATVQTLNTANNYTFRPIFNGVCSGASLVNAGLNIIVIKPVIMLAKGVAPVATFADPYVSGTAGTGLITKGVYDLNNKETSDKSVAKKLIAGGLAGIVLGTTRFAISHFSKSDVILDDKIPAAPYIIAGMTTLIGLTLALCTYRIKLGYIV